MSSQTAFNPSQQLPLLGFKKRGVLWVNESTSVLIRETPVGGYSVEIENLDGVWYAFHRVESLEQFKEIYYRMRNEELKETGEQQQ